MGGRLISGTTEAHLSAPPPQQRARCGDRDDVRTWPDCARLLPHALATAAIAEEQGVGLNAASRLISQMGVYAYGRADYATAPAAFERALRIGEKALGLKHPSVAIQVNNLGLVLRALGDLAGARAAYERALAIFRRVLGEDHPNTKIVRGNLEALPPG